MPQRREQRERRRHQAAAVPGITTRKKGEILSEK